MNAEPPPERQPTDVDPRVDAWEHRTEWPLLIVAVLFLAAYAIPIAWPNVPATVHQLCNLTVVLAWVIFALDYLLRLVIAQDRGHFFRHNLLDLAIVVLPMLRPLRLVLLLSAVQRLNRFGMEALRGRVVMYAFVGSALLIVAGALAVTSAERGAPGANIENLGDGFWWAIVSVATVGYGDFTPVTVTGRVVAVFLMLGGIGVLGVVTATLSSWLVGRVRDDGDGAAAAASALADPATHQQVADLSAQVRALSNALAQQRADDT